MSELSEISSGRLPADRARIQQSILEDQMDLWWFEDPKRSILCYSGAVVLILGTGVGGIVLLSSATSKSSEWRIGVGTVLCLLALLILLKQLLSSAIQDMNCMRNRAQIDILRSGGLIDHLVCLVAGSMLVTCGCILAILAKSDGYLADIPWNDMLVAGVTLTVAGSTILLSLLVYMLIIKFCPQIGARSPSRGIPNVYIISGGISERRLPPVELI
ncbi:transmembrane protein 125 [Callorhinchus milii]|uniref:Transmembrane protein 125-like n=1 Tax=Callorhinchus milii TaxID=7868 RepID=V9KMN4_CALMI|nr:transmembrane protein 125 [Callorhinchus milii]|eukprot:gi/632940365/ref/XP_007885279.1/ PREDICTED: transmembrane protein 125-like [Callorhinchus milii]